jgi:uncharacterized membrane protein
LAVEAAALAVLPLVFLVCRRLPDRGYLLSKPLGLLLVAYPVWLGASLKLFHFDQTTILLSLLALTASGAAIVAKQRGPLTAFLRENWRLVLVCERLFLLAFFAFRELRIASGPLASTAAAPMDLAYLTAVAHGATLSPRPWLWRLVNYYYFGQYLTAALLKLTTVHPQSPSTWQCYLLRDCAETFSVAYSLAAFSRRPAHASNASIPAGASTPPG